MNPKIAAAVEALISGIGSFLGPPDANVEYVARWQRGDFEVVIQKDEGPHVWLSTMWRPTGMPFRGLEIKTYGRDEPRHSGLGPTKSLGKGHAARCIKNVGNHVQAVVVCVRACAVDAGVIQSPEIHVVASPEESKVDLKSQ